MKHRIRFLGTLAFLAVLVNTILLVGQASAFTSVDRKAIGYAIDQCYSARAGTGNYIVARSIQLDELNDVSNVIMPTSNYMLHLPISPETLSLSQNNYSCYALFQGTKLIPTWDGGVNGLLSAAGVDKNLTTLEKKKALLDALGYKINDSNSNGWCFNLNLSRKQVNGDNIPKLQETQQICSMSGEVSGQGIEINGSAGGEALQPVVFSLAGDNLIMKLLNEQNIGNGYTEYTFDLNKYNNVQQIQTYGSAGQALAAELNNAFVNHFSNGVTTVAQAAGSPRYTYTYWKGDESSLVFEGSSNSNSAQYDLEGARTSAIKTANNLLGADFGGIADMAFTADEMYQLYMKYLTDFYGIDGGEGIQCNVDSATVNNLKNTGWQEIPYVLNGNLQTCYAKATRHTGQNDEDKVYGLNNQNLFTGERLSWTDLTTKLKNNASSMTAAGIADDGENGINFNNDKNNESIRATCMNTAGNTLGWVLCPILDMLSSTTDFLYKTMVAPNLRIEPMLFNQSSASGTKQAWDIFQRIANILIIALFLVVIFSQLTGVGIDNYGIKRILPKIIVVAILMNLSYYICLIFIDLSNIAGNGIQEILNGLPANVENSNFSFLTSTGSALISVGLAAGVASVASLAGVFSIATLLALIPTIASVGISFFFLFVILSAREAAVVILVVISPLAFVCYMLPNTKKWFDRWVKIMQALLLVYPICSLMVAGGNYVSKLLLSSGFGDGGFVNAITAMLVGIAPIFFIPSILKNSLSGLGNLGAKISNLGNRLGGSAANGIRKNELYQSALQSAQERRNMKMAGLRWNPNANGGSGAWENDTGLGARFKRRVASSAVGRATGLDRLQGRRAQRAEVDRSTAETERQNARPYILNTQAEKNMELYDNREGEAAGYMEDLRNMTPEELANRREARLTKTRDETSDRLASQRGATTPYLERDRVTDIEGRRIRSAGVQELARQAAADKLLADEGNGEEALRTRAQELNEANGNYTGDPRNRGLRSTTMTREYAADLARANRMKKQADVEAGVPQYRMDTLRTTANNNARMTNWQQTIGVAEINDDIARSRAEANLEAQEYKLAADEYTGKDLKTIQGKLAESARDTASNPIVRKAHMRAAADTLLKNNNVEEALEVYQGMNLASLDANNRSTMLDIAVKSGVPILKKYAKFNTSKAPSDMMDMNEYLTNPNGFALDSVNDGHGLDKAGKDVISVMAKVSSEGKPIQIPEEELLNAYFSPNNTDVKAQSGLVKIMNDAGKAAAIGSMIDQDRLRQASNVLIDSLVGYDKNGEYHNYVQGLVDTLNRPEYATNRAQFGEQLADKLGILQENKIERIANWNTSEILRQSGNGMNLGNVSDIAKIVTGRSGGAPKLTLSGLQKMQDGTLLNQIINTEPSNVYANSLVNATRGIDRTTFYGLNSDIQSAIYTAYGKIGQQFNLG